MNLNKFLLHLYLIHLFIITEICGTLYPITTLINAKWNQTPIYLEIAEYLADENNAYFWDFLDQISDLQVPLKELGAESKQYGKSIEISKNILGSNSMQLPLLKLAVSMHSLTPRIQTHLQTAENELKRYNNKCDSDIFLVMGDNTLCNFHQLEETLNNYETNSNNEQNEIYSFDHIYPSSEMNSIEIILYADIGSANFIKYHKLLKNYATSGKIKYIVRHHIKEQSSKKVRLSGYGVELHLKSTEYHLQDDSPQQSEHKPKEDEVTENIVEGFDFQILKSHYPDLEHSLNRLRSSLLEKNEELAPLKAWEFQDLGVQAAERIAHIQGEESLHILQYTAQNFPSQAKSLLVQTVSNDLKKEMKHNAEVFGRSLNIQPPDAALFVNGLFFDVDTLELISLLETLRSESRVMDVLHKNEIRGKVASKLLSLDISNSATKDFAIDIRDSSIFWINDVENDMQYRRWPTSVMDLLRPTFPGMLRNIRKNFFNLVLIFDPIKPDSRPLIKLAESFVVHAGPIRLGVVFDTRNKTDETESAYRAMFCAFNYLSQKKDLRKALSFLTDIYASVKEKNDVTYKNIESELSKVFSSLSLNDIEDVLSENSEYDFGGKLAEDFIERLNFRNNFQAIMNGVPMLESLLNTDDFEEAIYSEVLQLTQALQKAVFRGDLTDSDVVIDYLMNQPHVMPRLNQRILSSENVNYLDLSGTPHDINNLNVLAQLSDIDTTATLLRNLKYFTSKHSTDKILGKEIYLMTVWVVADLNTANGKELLLNALKYMKSVKNCRVAFIPNIEGPKTLDKNNINRIIWASSQALNGYEATAFAVRTLEKNSKEAEIPENIKDLLSATELHIKMLRIYSQRILKLKASERLILTNGKIYGPFLSDETFTVDDFSLMERCNNLQYGEKIRKILESSEEDLQISSDIMLKLIARLVPQQAKTRFTIPTDVKESHSVIQLDPKSSSEPYFEITAVLDPASRAAQKLAPYLILLRSIANCNMRVFLCAVENHSDMPVKNYYRFVIEPELQFSPDGNLMSSSIAKFTNLPQSPLFTQNLQVPENWLIEPVRSVYDLDNIKLIEIGGPVHSEFELEYLLLEGHCFDTLSGAPPRGLQVTLGTNRSPVVVDTIVMANLGYFQLKAKPGIWELRLRQGKSADIYNIVSADGPNTNYTPESTKVVISSLRSHVIKLRVTKKPDMQGVDLLGNEDDKKGGIWDSITSSFSSGGDAAEEETINIFSVASGHLYERLLRIMMLSLLKHTKSPVKFWFLKNYLSPQFTEFLPHMAKNYSFEFELVQYKWPRWLHQQTEKQRTIWGYKILFLDVLFPLDVKKIIFVDADAIVRSDIKELNELDLNDAPYAYTPFCDSRKEMEGFRFWKQGYWRNHLMGRRYHISAIYVVDLKRFRKIAAGDRLRGQYQALSQDPNSLSNLDQDLPNNMIHQVAIKSLPDEWLWCETWCSDSSFKKAKVIDLCNNPQTKEAKLTAAQRIVPEWKDYDLEIRKLIAKIEDHEMEIQDESIERTDNNEEATKHSEL